MSKNEISAADVRLGAMNFLALREHSIKELTDKLVRKYGQSEHIEKAIAELAEQGLQSDERFAEAFIRMRQRQGKGSSLIKMELRERGISSCLVDTLIDERDTMWTKLAREVRSKRFTELPAGAREKAKQMRFLHSRGFASHHIQAAFSGLFDNS
ncbi:regulatory protein RecX [Cellvibrio sp. UBA7661]|uniref:regulatory protein RecX n=1 Tax=Cellvibrio sp. UBA7661 TaxID=1946311 RepID=UPI002F359AFD